MRPGYVVGVFALLALTVAGALPAGAQSIVGRLQVAPLCAAPGDTVTAEVIVDLGTNPAELGAHQARLTWDASVLELAELLNGDTPAFANPQTHSVPGELAFSQFSAQGAGGSINLIRIRLAVIGQVGQSSALALSFTTLDAAGTFADLLPVLTVELAGVVQVVSITGVPTAVEATSWGEVKGEKAAGGGRHKPQVTRPRGLLP